MRLTTLEWCIVDAVVVFWQSLSQCFWTKPCVKRLHKITKSLVSSTSAPEVSKVGNDPAIIRSRRDRFQDPGS